MSSVLIVEDEADLREGFSHLLEAHGYVVRQAVDGVAALQELEEERPSVILLDLMMPRMDGVTFRRLQLADPAIAGVPVVFMSAAWPLLDGASGLCPAACLAKPFEERSLVEAIQSAIAAGE